jgi:dTDP-4-amino-4,6-dideoxygalactose transaminase
MSRNDMMEQLQARGISTRPGTHAVHMLAYYRNKYQLKPSDYPGAQLANDSSMAIPLHNRMSSEDYRYVVDALKAIG